MTHTKPKIQVNPVIVPPTKRFKSMTAALWYYHIHWLNKMQRFTSTWES